MAEFDQELDASGLNCPLPILRAKKTLTGMDAGKVLHIIATDPGSVKDFEAFAKQIGWRDALAGRRGRAPARRVEHTIVASLRIPAKRSRTQSPAPRLSSPGPSAFRR